MNDPGWRCVGVAVMLVLLAPIARPLAPGVGRSGPQAQGLKQVKVAFEVRQSGTQSREAAQGSGRVIITERGGARPSGRVGVESSERRVTRTTGIFTIVQDGGVSTLTVASEVPYPQVAYYRDYLTGAGYPVGGIAFKDVGTSLRVWAAVLSGNQVRLRMTPAISWLAEDRPGLIEVREASTELIVPSGRPVVIGGATATLNELTRHILSFAETRAASDTIITVTATVLD